MTPFPLYNTQRAIVYNSLIHITQGISTFTTPIDYTTMAIVQHPLPIEYVPTVYTFSFDSTFDPKMFNFITTNPINTIGDLINNWNAQAIKYGNHTLAMTPYYDDAAYVYITNVSDIPVHMWASSNISNYFGVWAPQEIRKVSVLDFVSMTFTDYVLPPSPIIVTDTVSVFEATAYLYRRKASVVGEYYTKKELVMIHPGFYSDIVTFVAVLNSQIQMRGERNGFIYHFITDGKCRIGLEATHRQPEPSVLVMQAHLGMNPCGLGFECHDEQVTLPLRTAKRILLKNPMAAIM